MSTFTPREGTDADKAEKPAAPATRYEWPVVPLIGLHNNEKFGPEHIIWKEDPSLFRLRLFVVWRGTPFLMDTAQPYMELGATIDDIASNWGPSFPKVDEPDHPWGEHGRSNYKVELVKLRKDTFGLERPVTSKVHHVSPEKYPLKPWNLESPSGGDIPADLAVHLTFRSDHKGELFLDNGEFEDVSGFSDRDGGRGRDEYREGDGYYPNDRDGSGGGYQTRGAGGGYGVGASYAGQSAGRPNVPPPVFSPDGRSLWTGSPPGFNPPAPGRWMPCTNGEYVWVGNHYEPAPNASTTTASAGNASADEVPPIVNGLLYTGTSWVPCMHGATKIGGRWVPNPDPRDALTPRSRQLMAPMPEQCIENPEYYIVDGATEPVHAPYGMRRNAEGQWVPKPPPPPPPPREEKPKGLLGGISAGEAITLFGAAGAALQQAFSWRVDAARAEADARVRAENERATTERERTAAERAKAEAERDARIAEAKAKAEAESARIAADDARRKDDETRRETERRDRENRESAEKIARENRESAEKIARETAEREARKEAEARFEKLAAALKPHAPPVDPQVAALLGEVRGLQKQLANGGGGGFMAELDRVTSVAKKLGFERADGGGGGDDATGFALMAGAEKLLESIGKFAQGYLEKVRSEHGIVAHEAPTASPPQVVQTQVVPSPLPAPPYPAPAGYVWWVFPGNVLGLHPDPALRPAAPQPPPRAPIRLPPPAEPALPPAPPALTPNDLFDDVPPVVRSPRRATTTPSAPVAPAHAGSDKATDSRETPSSESPSNAYDPAPSSPADTSRA